MRWHKEKRLHEDGVLRHPADSKVWKDFDNQYPWFAQNARNVRLALATDGFNPFGTMSNSYSMWPVVLVPYNMPPWKCDAPKPGGPLTTRQPVENLYISYHETHT